MTEHAPGFATLAIHAGAPGDLAHDPREAPNGFAEAAALLRLDNFGAPCADSLNPTNAALEERMAALEGGSAALALASGQAAPFLVLNMLLEDGDELIAAGKPSHVEEAYQSFGWQVKWVDPTNAENFARALSPKTKAILIDSLAGSGTIVPDMAAIAAIAKEARLPFIVDNTFATPYLTRPIEHGADIVLHSATKFLAGHEGLTGGIVIDAGTFPWQQDPRFPLLSKPQPDYGDIVFADIFGNFAFAAAARIHGLAEFGPALSAVNAASALTGLETLALRMERHSNNAQRVAEHLAAHKAVSAVTYPGLPDDATHAPAQIYFPRGLGALLTCRLAGGYHAARAFVQNLKLFSGLEDLGDTRSRASHPASMTHRYLSDSEKDIVGAAPDLVRLSIGLEDINDILADLDQALAAA
jgi:O-acetylhomoserine (thiol)-lyase